MRRFQSILNVTHPTLVGGGALEQALTEARQHEASLQALVICPPLPRALESYRPEYEASLRENLQAALSNAQRSLGIAASDVPVTVEVDCEDGHAVNIVRRVLRGPHDLLIKQAEPTDRRTGFRSLDMQLLRLCPVPVWLCRAPARARTDLQVAVAVNPQSREPEGWDLAVKLLQLSRSLADTHSGKLQIISCWGFDMEGDLRHSPWLKMPEEYIRDAVANVERQHREALEKLVRESGIVGTASVLLRRGRPEKVIPRLVDTQGIDLLVMGTIGRTGIQGLVMGNTTEDVVGEISCSLLAVKPNGFVSPVRAYE